MKSIEEYYDDLINEVSEARYLKIQNDPKEAEKFMEEVTNHYAGQADFLYDQWKDNR